MRLDLLKLYYCYLSQKCETRFIVHLRSVRLDLLNLLLISKWRLDLLRILFLAVKKLNREGLLEDALSSSLCELAYQSLT